MNKDAIRLLLNASVKAGIQRSSNDLKALEKLLQMKHVDYSNKRSKALWGLYSSGWERVVDRLVKMNLATTSYTREGNLLTITLNEGYIDALRSSYSH